MKIIDLLFDNSIVDYLTKARKNNFLNFFFGLIGISATFSGALIIVAIVSQWLLSLEQQISNIPIGYILLFGIWAIITLLILYLIEEFSEENSFLFIVSLLVGAIIGGFIGLIFFILLTGFIEFIGALYTGLGLFLIIFVIIWLLTSVKLEDMKY